ncbi:MAG: NADH-quinone oxidoreductase subunit C [Deltaproteobacteria bacterium]|jgi:Ni,Fe-hydrogenase III large subunit|nr:NADH-quinone oxidoreductase subunit C [Deltaproteobacteria bacterium]
MSTHCTMTNGQAVPIQSIPHVHWKDFSDWILAECASGAHVCSFFGLPEKELPPPARLPGTMKGKIRIFAILARANEATLGVASSSAAHAYPSLTPLLPSLHLFERNLHEKYGLVPQGHPWLKPVRFPHAEGPRAGDMEFFSVGGDEVHEVAVGPIHAGIIECGHFRFQCLGETVMHLEISLGYHHRGIEQALTGGPGKNTFPVMETLAGDTSVGHAWAACGVVEALADCAVAPRGQLLRAIALELERLANHTGDLGALAGDVGFLPTASYCGRIRGDFLNMTAALCGNRFGRGLVRPGGTAFDLDGPLALDLAERVRKAHRDVRGAAALLFNSTSVTARMMGIGTLSRQAASDMGMVGPAARASNLRLDARVTHPLPHLRGHDLHICTEPSGDVQARAMVRMREISESAAFVSRLLGHLPEGESMAAPFGPSRPAHEVMLAPLSFGLALVEGWRGEICHAALTDNAGHFCHYAVTDPSFHNWAGLALALRDQEISDFPLCNKSFNLSYCGHDL